MDIEDTRLAAVKTLLDDEIERRDRANWEAILSDTTLTPDTKTPIFEQQLYDFLIVDMENSYRRKETLQREKRKKTGRSGGFIPPQMRISPDIGRFLFACFKWHGFNQSQTAAKINPKGLEDLAEAFGFKIDPMENQRQFINEQDRKDAIMKEDSASYNLRMIGLIVGGLFITLAIVMRYLMRRSGL